MAKPHLPHLAARHGPINQISASPHHLCVAVDGSDISLRALESVAPFSNPSDTVLVLICVLPTHAAHKINRIEHQVQMIGARCQIKKLRCHFQNVEDQAHVPQAILDFVKQQQQCDLICLGTRHSLLGTQQPVGRVTDAVVRGSRTPVCVIRPFSREVYSSQSPQLGLGFRSFSSVGTAEAYNSLSHIPTEEPVRLRYAVAVDGSEVCLAGLEYVFTLANTSDEVIIFSCCSKSDADRPLNSAAALVRTLARDAQNVVTRAMPRNLHVSLGDDLCRVAAELDADYLVLATGWTDAHQLGSVCIYCIYHAKCNLLIYKNARFKKK